MILKMMAYGLFKENTCCFNHTSKKNSSKKPSFHPTVSGDSDMSFSEQFGEDQDILSDSEHSISGINQPITDDSKTYFGDGWNILDFIIVISSLVSELPWMSNLTGVRVLRVLRPLRTINRVPGMQVIILTLLSSFKQLIDVSVLLLFLFVIYGIAGVQMFNGALHQRCVPTDDTVQYIPSLLPYCGYHNCDSAQSVCETIIDKQAIIGFDHIFQAFFTVFQVITLEGWSQIMYDLWDASSPASWVYFISLVFLVSFFGINLVLAIIADTFAAFSRRKRHELKQQRARHKQIQELRRKRRQKLAAMKRHSNDSSDTRDAWIKKLLTRDSSTSVDPSGDSDGSTSTSGKATLLQSTAKSLLRKTLTMAAAFRSPSRQADDSNTSNENWDDKIISKAQQKLSAPGNAIPRLKQLQSTANFDTTEEQSHSKSQTIDNNQKKNHAAPNNSSSMTYEVEMKPKDQKTIETLNAINAMNHTNDSNIDNSNDVHDDHTSSSEEVMPIKVVQTNGASIYECDDGEYIDVNENEHEEIPTDFSNHLMLENLQHLGFGMKNNDETNENNKNNTTTDNIDQQHHIHRTQTNSSENSDSDVSSHGSLSGSLTSYGLNNFVITVVSDAKALANISVKLEFLFFFDIVFMRCQV